MASYVKYQLGIEKMMEAGNAGTDTWKLKLTNAAPTVATDTTIVSELASSGGYTVGGVSCTITSAVSTAGVYKLILAAPASPTWTASGGGFTFRYVVLVNETLGQCIGYWDYGSSVALSGTNADTFTPTLDAANGVFTVT
jgi:hypothetical protein